jgi:hypothetical protein
MDAGTTAHEAAKVTGPIASALACHARTKHHFGRYAAGPGSLN